MKPRTAKIAKRALAGVVLTVIGAGLAWYLESRNPAPPVPARPLEARAPEMPPPPPPLELRDVAHPISPPDSRRPRKEPLPPPPSNSKAAPPETKPAEPPPETASPKGKEPVQDPIARAALALVGTDEEAEAIWLAAINNPDLPANERKDLIEDLNEDGFPNPRSVTADDLPLIQSRIRIIEELMLDPLDETNAAALAEAYTDLLRMLERASQ